MVVVIDHISLGTGLSMSAIVVGAAISSLTCIVCTYHFPISNSSIKIVDQSWEMALHVLVSQGIGDFKVFQVKLSRAID